MPYANDIFYTTDGPADAPLLLLSNSIGCTHELWEPNLAALAERFHVVRYDTRGHGRSATPGDAFTMEQLGRDAIGVIDAAGGSRTRTAHVLGISLGGVTAMWLGVNAADRVERLVLANTGAKIGTVDGWNERMRGLREHGMGAVADASMARWFTPPFRERHADVVARYRAMVAACPADGYLGCSAAIRDTDLREDIRRITAPTLVIVGAQDLSTTPADGALIQDRIPGARLASLDCAHLSNIERASEFSAAVLEFLSA
jgi:3-oxoadipate enol-lactonase